MGCDGGTIPKRKEIVKKKSTDSRKKRDKDAEEAEKWRTCSLSDCLLLKPIVANPYGFLMSKEEAIQYLIEKRKDSLTSDWKREDKPNVLNPIQSMKDIKTLKLKENTKASNDQPSTSADGDVVRADFVCPITGLETNGKYNFVFSWVCGCVVSERAIKEVPNDEKCLVCQTPYKPWELVKIHPNAKELETNQAAFMVRKMAESELARKEKFDRQRSSKTSSTRKDVALVVSANKESGSIPKRKSQEDAAASSSTDKDSVSGSNESLKRRRK